jgi:soluble lytic murein transglycosylase
MSAFRRVAGVLSCSVFGVMAAGWTVLPGLDNRLQCSRPSVREFAQLLPFERNKVEPIDPRAAFVEGYQAYKRRDLIETIGRMRFASSALPELADYALFYLASAERDSRDSQGAADDFRRLTLSYPQSVLADAGGEEYARLELGLGRPDYALAAAMAVTDSTTDPSLEQNARLTMAQSMLATGAWRDAYNQAQIIRQKFPGGGADAPARELAYSTLRAHPEASDAPPLEYHRTEAALLLREGQNVAAQTQIREAVALQPAPMIRAELVWFSAEAARGKPDRMKAELERYLGLAPHGPNAARALDGLAHLYWHENDTARARLYFGRLTREFPHDAMASTAMFETGRTYEEEGDLESARSEYLALLARYPTADAAADARFRAPFMLYMMTRFGAAAAEFRVPQTHSATPGERDMFVYWRARALQKKGDRLESQRLWRSLAVSIDSNYYPALAAMRVDVTPAVLPAALAPDVVAGAVPTADGPVQFHLARVAALRGLGLGELEPPELRVVEPHVGGNALLRDFVLAELQSTGAWFDAIQMAIRMGARGEIDPLTAERIRYPRGFWTLVSITSAHNQLDPYLVAALIRQESLFNPQARSVSDARGLMQLMPATALRWAIPAGMGGPLDLYDPNISVQLGTVYLHALLAMFGGDIFKAVAAYNAGEHAVAEWNAKYPGDDDQWVENIGFRETRDYVKKVIGGTREYRLLYKSPSAASASTHAPQSPG